jgi:hypothetical protein
MIDDDLVLRVERLRDSVEDFKGKLRKRYKKKTGQVSATVVQTEAAQLAERWLVEVAGREDVKVAITDEVLADLNVAFQRLLTYSERQNSREKYDAVLKTILWDFRANVIVVLKRNRGVEFAPPVIGQSDSAPPASAFVGQSFAEADIRVNEPVRRFLEAFGLSVTTGEKPSAQTVSSKVKARIEEADIFVGIFTRRDKLAGKEEWSASAWVIDEKAYALAKGKRLVLLKEAGVSSVGGLQGDYEYLEFERGNLEDLLVRLLETLRGLGDRAV